MSEHTDLLRNLAKEAAQVNAEQTMQDEEGKTKNSPFRINFT